MELPFLEIIEAIAPDPNLLLWKFPDQDLEIKNGAQLTVRESQSVLLLQEGKISDVFGPGLHTLSTENIPVLSSLKGWKYGFESPFKVDIYFLNTHPFLNNKWGTPAPILMRDPEFGQVRIRAFGSYDIRIAEADTFFREYAGTFPVLTIQELQNQLRDFIAPNFGEVLAKAGLSILDVSGNVNELGKKIEPLLRPYFEKIGLELLKFIITSVTLPDEVQTHIDQMTQMNMTGDLDRYKSFMTAKAVREQGSAVAEGTGAALMMGAMLQQMQSAPTEQASQQADDPAIRLKKLKDLLDGGLIDENDYKAKKEEIIKNL